MREEKKKQKELEKAAKKAEKAARQAQNAAAAAGIGAVVAAVRFLSVEDPPSAIFGPYEMMQSACGVDGSGREFVRVEDVTAQMVGQRVWIRARLATKQAKGKAAFLVLRQVRSTIQVTIFDSEELPKTLLKWVKDLTTESVVDVLGDVVSAEVRSCTQSDVEIQCQRIYCVSKAKQPPFRLEDAARPDAEEGVHVLRDTRLDDRVLDLRVPAHKSIMRIQSGVCQIFREALLERDFIEIHSPKLIAGTSEGGADVFETDYFGRKACLAQSPQLYKQMAICGDFERVFEIGPVFRAERSNTHRHLCEFVGLDFEMTILDHYYEIVRIIDHLFVSIFDGLQRRHALDLATIGAQYPFEPLRYRKAGENLILQFHEGIRMLREDGVEIEDFSDLNTEQEKRLGKLVREKFDTDFYFLTRFPSAIRPFYTMPEAGNSRYSNSFDVFMRGEEIISGAQRIHDPELLAKRAEECGIDVDTIRDYIKAFSFGAPPHGGAGVGLERVVMLLLAISNIRECSLFPRDPQRLTP
uniref:aspartate--tRNA ligase n=1 Tax=Compsopogon caeruleus TaxID=31354 RepID=A0A7S1T7F6_9RHOD|mmetsp:Transcript_11833/g.24111  ORF Transcript_11833/g.24111 Transcript_11833/m.24111 type:complete len:525 (+) Transcript_11833:422-1996(+)